MRISDWSSDVCSSDLGRAGDAGLGQHAAAEVDAVVGVGGHVGVDVEGAVGGRQVGETGSRQLVQQYLAIGGIARQVALQLVLALEGRRRSDQNGRESWRERGGQDG